MLKLILASILVLGTSGAQAAPYSKTLNIWQQALKTNKLAGTTWAGIVEGNGVRDRLHRNKQRTTIIYKPAWFDPTKKDTETIFWFHGCNGYGLRTFATRTLGHVASMRTTNFIFIIPEMPWSQNTKTICRRQRMAWNGSPQNDIKVFYNSVRTKIKNLWGFDILPTYTTMIGHSAGGAALANAAKSGGLDYIQPDKVVFSDAGYGRWTDMVWKYYGKGRQNFKFLLFVRKWDTPYRHTVRFLKKFKRRPSNIYLKVFARRSYTHGRIGDESLSLRVLF